MNKYIVIILLGIITVVLAESSLKRDKDTLIKGRGKFQFVSSYSHSTTTQGIQSLYDNLHLEF